MTFAQFEERNLLESGHNLVENEPILDSINRSFAEDNSDEEYISTISLHKIRYGKYAHKNINTIYARLIICDRIREAKSECKGVEPSVKIMVEGLHKVFKVFVK